MNPIRWFSRASRDSLPPYRRERVVSLRDGRRYRVRPVRPSDEPALTALLERLDPEEVRRRFFVSVRRFSHRLVGPLAESDNRRFGLVAATEDAPAEFVASAMLVAEPDRAAAEFALLVHHAQTQHGLGRHLLEGLLEHARALGVGTVYGLVLRENSAMLDVATELGFRQMPDPSEPGCVRVELDTGPSADRVAP